VTAKSKKQAANLETETTPGFIEQLLSPTLPRGIVDDVGPLTHMTNNLLH
jgi:hypothetical protein